MTQKKSTAQRLGRVLETVTSQSSRLPTTPEYGSWILGRVSESQGRRRIRIQIILTLFVVVANLIGITVALLVIPIRSAAGYGNGPPPGNTMLGVPRSLDFRLTCELLSCTARVITPATTGP